MRGAWLVIGLTVWAGCRGQPISTVSRDTDEMRQYVQDPNSIVKWYNWSGARREVTGWYPTDYRVDQVYRLRNDAWAEHREASGHLSPNRIVLEGPAPAGSPPVTPRVKLPAGTRFQFQQMWIEADGKSDANIVPYARVLDGPLQGQMAALDALSSHERRDANDIPRPCNVGVQYLEPVDPAPPPTLPATANGAPPLPPGTPPNGLPQFTPPPVMNRMPFNVGLGPIGNGPVQVGVGPFGGPR